MNEAIQKPTLGTVLDNQALCDAFLCSGQGGMRRSLRTNSLVIVSNHVKSIYQDRWIDDVIHYTGMGTVGDQRLDGTQNKTLGESRVNGVAIHLFEVFIGKEYTYVGEVALADEPYQETQPDENQDLRKVWMFPLKLSTGEQIQVPETLVRKNRETKERQAKKLTNAELRNRANCSSKQAGTRTGPTTTFERSPWVSEYAKRWANGVCQLCEQDAPFKDKSGDPFLESHHIIWLARGGDDSIENSIALCPNCHRKIHALDLESDSAILIQKVEEQMANESLEAPATSNKTA